MLKLHFNTKIKFLIIVLLTFSSLFFVLKKEAHAGQVGHVFFIRLPDGSREKLPGASVRSITTRDEKNFKSSSSVCSYDSYPLRYLPDSQKGGGNVCATGVSCYDDIIFAPFLPLSFNSSQAVYTIGNANGAGTMDASYFRFTGISGGLTFTQKYPWFPFQQGNPRGSSTAYWVGRTRHTNTEENVRVRFFANTSNLFPTDRLSAGRQAEWTAGFKSIPGFTNFTSANQMQWYGVQNKLPFMGADVNEVGVATGGANGYYATVEWTLVETNPQPVCGNGTMESGETCDNGTQNGTACIAERGSTCQYCATTCQIVVVDNPFVCGDGVMDTGEFCDNGDQNGAECTAQPGGTCQYCTNECEVETIEQPYICGDGVMDPGEACDNGGLNGAECTATSGETCNYCSTACEVVTVTQEAACGDSVLNPGEECDMGTSNGQAGVACTIGCTLPSCGNGVTETGESCDLGANNGQSGSTCTSTCTIPSCGNGDVEMDEECDDGVLNGTNASDCTSSCTNVPNPTCGNGVVDTGEMCGEVGLSCGANQLCQSCTCITLAAGGTCGDGILNIGETCDDGNFSNADGCSSACQLEQVPNTALSYEGAILILIGSLFILGGLIFIKMKGQNILFPSFEEKVVLTLGKSDK